MPEHRNIKFYSVADLSSGFHLQEAEAVFQNWDEHINSADINILIELYNIKKYIDADARLNQWNDEQFAEYKSKCKVIPQILGKYFSTISDNNLESIYKATDSNYTDDLWQLICTYKTYQRITPEVLGQLLNSDEYIVWEVLCHKELVKAFGQVIAEHLTGNGHTAEHLISHFLAAHERNESNLYFPTEFTQEMRNNVLADFVERDDANINSLQLLE